MATGLTRRRALATGGSLLAWGLAGCSRWGREGGGLEDPGASWPQSRFDAGRRGANLHASGPTEPGERWSIETGSRTSGAVVSDGRVVAGGEGIAAFASQDGTEHWHTVSPFASRATPTVFDGTVYAGSRSILYALAIETGERRWTHSSDLRHFHAPTVADETVLVGTTVVRFSTDFDAEIIAYAATTGKERWRARVGSNVLPPYAPATDGDRVYVGRDRLTALDFETGEEEWRISPAGVSAFADPVVVDGQVYVPGVRPRDGVPAGVVLAIDADDGSEVWRVETELSPASVAVADGTVFVTADAILALDAEDGTAHWSVDENRFLTAAPSVAAGHVFVAGIDGTVMALETDDGTPVWRTRLPGSLLSAPAIAEKTLYVGTSEGRLYALGSRDSVQ